jgi:protocatechuate 3,4-dioxygenase beta subunit
MPMSTANTTIVASAIADTSLPMGKVATTSAPSCPRSILARQAPERPVLTTQLYFPDEPANRRDGLFRRELAMRIAEAADGLAAHFDFVLEMR